MKITRSTDVNHVVKPEGTSVNYYIFDDYEVHYNEQAAHTAQTWHHHEQIWETLYIIDGQLTARWRDEGEEKSQVVTAGDLIETERTPHTFLNDSDETVRFLVIKRLPSGENQRQILASDKVLD